MEQQTNEDKLNQPFEELPSIGFEDKRAEKERRKAEERHQRLMRECSGSYRITMQMLKPKKKGEQVTIRRGQRGLSSPPPADVETEYLLEYNKRDRKLWWRKVFPWVEDEMGNVSAIEQVDWGGDGKILEAFGDNIDEAKKPSDWENKTMTSEIHTKLKANLLKKLFNENNDEEK